MNTKKLTNLYEHKYNKIIKIKQNFDNKLKGLPLNKKYTGNNS